MGNMSTAATSPSGSGQQHRTAAAAAGGATGGISVDVEDKRMSTNRSQSFNGNVVDRLNHHRYFCFCKREPLLLINNCFLKIFNHVMIVYSMRYPPSYNPVHPTSDPYL